ncbi:MAG TPA: hypothetical protein P5560_01515 [Thermotogota bacterium]|nr:hypothetical protein [Thermotogota bacterium]
MPVKNPFLSKAKLLATGVNDPFEEELRALSGPKRVFQFRIETVTLEDVFIVQTLAQPSFSLDPNQSTFRYHGFLKNPIRYGLFLDQDRLLRDARVLFEWCKNEFQDLRAPEEILTDSLMTVFWSSLFQGYFFHLVESHIFRLRELGLFTPPGSEEIAGVFEKPLMQDLSLAYAFRNLPQIVSFAGVPSGNPFDYQWVARYYLRQLMEVRKSRAMEFIGDTRWLDGAERFFSESFPQVPRRVFSLLPESGIDTAVNIPVYLEYSTQMPAFSTTIKSGPRTLDNVLREAGELHRKFFREILNLVEFSLNLSINLDDDVGFSVENEQGQKVLELFPQTFTHSSLFPFRDVLEIPEEMMEHLRSEKKEEWIDELLQEGFETEPDGRLVLAFSSKMGWSRWTKIRGTLRKIMDLMQKKGE